MIKVDLEKVRDWVRENQPVTIGELGRAFGWNEVVATTVAGMMYRLGYLTKILDSPWFTVREKS